MDSKAKTTTLSYADVLKNGKLIDEINELPSEEIKAVVKAESEDETLKITDLNDYCLEQIFSYLDWKDLWNVAISNTIFQYAACVVFKQKHSVLRLLDDISLHFTINDSELQSFLLIFGDLISSISISRSDYSGRFLDHFTKKTLFALLYVITKHSLKSLTSINIEGMDASWFREFSKPLPQVESVSIESKYYKSDESSMVSDIFPNLSYLSLCSTDGTTIHQNWGHFPYLKTLDFRVCYQNENEFKHLLELNPQLSSLIVRFKSRFDNMSTILRFIGEKLQLEKLVLYLSKTIQSEVVHFKSLKYFECYYRFDYNSKFKFPVSSDQLEELTLNFWDKYTSRVNVNIKHIDKILKKNAKIIKLTIHGVNDVNKSTEMGRLPEITIEKVCLDSTNDVDSMAEFLNEKSSASTIKFKESKFVGSWKYQSLQAKIDKRKWNINLNVKNRDDSYYYYPLVLKRRI